MNEIDVWNLGILQCESRGGSRIYKRGVGLTQGTNLLGRGVQTSHAGTRGVWGHASPGKF